MNHFITIGAAAIAAVAVPGAAFAAPGAPVNTVKIPLVNDCGHGALNGSCQSLDMIGTFAGVVKFRHKGNGDLRVMINVKSAPASRTYQLAIYCGTSAARASAVVGELAGALMTDASGAGTAGPFEVPAADIRSACGSGNAIGHLALADTAGLSILDAAPIKMTPG